MSGINIIYYGWCNPKKNYKNIILGQLSDMILYGILNDAKLYLEICCEDLALHETIQTWLDEKLQGTNYEITFHLENIYEYYGIKKLYDLAVLEPLSYFLYLHSKGMFNYPNINERHIYDKTLTKGTIQNYKHIVKLFDENDRIMKAALFPSIMHKSNFCWFNFFWARGSYLITCENPIITDDRFYYERWSESGDNSMGTVYNMYEKNYKKYELFESGGILNKLNGTYISMDESELISEDTESLR